MCTALADGGGTVWSQRGRAATSGCGSTSRQRPHDAAVRRASRSSSRGSACAATCPRCSAPSRGAPTSPTACSRSSTASCATIEHDARRPGRAASTRCRRPTSTGSPPGSGSSSTARCPRRCGASSSSAGPRAPTCAARARPVARAARPTSASTRSRTLPVRGRPGACRARRAPTCPPDAGAAWTWDPPPLILEHYRLRRWFELGAGRLGDQAVLWGKRIVNRSQLGRAARRSG